jgi:hypothetical protein
MAEQNTGKKNTLGREKKFSHHFLKQGCSNSVSVGDRIFIIFSIRDFVYGQKVICSFIIIIIIILIYIY